MKRTALLVAAVILVLAAGAYVWGCYMDCEYIHWRTIWQASRAKTSTGVSVANLMRKRFGVEGASLDWHHCGWCETVYSHAEHCAIKVTVSESEAYLFDWDRNTGRLLPITIRTAEVFPELLPLGFAVQRLSDFTMGEEFQNDQRCRVALEMPKS